MILSFFVTSVSGRSTRGLFLLGLDAMVGWDKGFGGSVMTVAQVVKM